MVSKNVYRSWNKSSSTSIRSSNPKDAANRVYDAFFVPGNLSASSIPLRRKSEVFTIGSCFARELETELLAKGFRVTSMDFDRLSDSTLWADRKATANFFHRYTLPSMEVEVRRVLGDTGFTEERDLLIELGGVIHDLNYGPNSLPALDRAGAVERRRISRQMMTSVTTADWIVVTLGLTEAWYYKPDGFVCNGVNGEVLGRYRNDLEFMEFGFAENLASLERIFDCIKRHHKTGRFTFVLTVSPVPLQTTFSDQDVVVANTRSKSILRAVADQFCATNDQAIYFPSYEIALHSNRDMVWRPDRVHINPACVAHIMDVFQRTYVAQPTAKPHAQRNLFRSAARSIVRSVLR